MENVKYPPWGVNGGHGGRPGKVVVNPGTSDERELKPLSDGNRLVKGDLVRIMTAGGGGWGSPLDRPAGQVRDDVLDGFISRQSAERDYGVVLDAAGLEIDEAATTRLRASLPAPSGLYHRGTYFNA